MMLNDFVKARESILEHFKTEANIFIQDIHTIRIIPHIQKEYNFGRFFLMFGFI